MMTRENDSYSSSTSPSKEAILGRLSYGKLVFLCVIALALSVVGPLSIFAPLPLAVAFLLYGIAKTLTVSGVLIAVTFVASMSSPGLSQLSHYGVMLVMSVILSFAISSIILKGEHPVKGLITRGLYILGAIAVLIGFAEIISSEPLTVQIETLLSNGITQMKEQPNFQEVIKAGGEQARVLEEILSNPKEILKTVYSWAFAGIFVGIYFVLWMTLFMLLRNSAIWKEVHEYKYGLKDLVRFKAPDFMIYFVVIGFGLFIGGEYLGGKSLEVVGGNILWCLGVFYFFQGMGIYLDLLKFLKIKGILRSILTIMTIFMAYRFVAIIGLFDLWVNFRKYLKRKEN